ncbi:bromodomain-containing protein 8-like [Hetaerina americana]|uniref:bromodomain-containing protein 8-like n=1 Tax=Hetaerina americana TaxID=62018 RepID=UPI003A7F1DC3
MNKLKMAAIQERLKLKRVQIDTWTTREKLCLASAVLRSGDQNWVSVSRTLRGFDELNRPPDWFSQKNCALQYSSLLEKVDTPKRKRGERGEVHVETPGECIVRKLTSERVEELKKSIEFKKSLHHKLREEIAMVKSGQADDRLDDMLLEIEEEKLKKKREAEMHAKWLKEREEKLLEIKRAWRPPAASSSTIAMSADPKQREMEAGARRSSSQSEQSSEAESLEDSPLSSDPLQVDVIGDESLEGRGETKPCSPLRESSPQPTPAQLPCTSSAPATTPTPTSPLLTILLKSQSQAPSLQASSILHSAITAQRGSSPTITSLLNSSPGVPFTGAVTPTVSAGIKSLVTSAISNTGSDDQSEKAQQSSSTTPSPSAGAPTLSMLLELPPSQPGKPLPEIPSIPPKLPSTPAHEGSPVTPAPSPPPSPQPAQGPESSQPASPKMEEGQAEEEESPEEVSKAPEKESEVREEEVETSEEVRNGKEAAEGEECKAGKPEADTSPISEAEVKISSVVEDSKDFPPADLESQPNVPCKEQEPASETDAPKMTEESIPDVGRTTQAVEIELIPNVAGDLSSQTELLQPSSPNAVEGTTELNTEAAVDVIKEEMAVVSSQPDVEVEGPELNEKMASKELAEETVSSTADKPIPDQEETLETPEKKTDIKKEDEAPERETLNEREIPSILETEKKVSDKEKAPSPTSQDAKIAEEPSFPEISHGSLKREESSADAVSEKDNVEGRSLLEESIHSAPETPNTDLQVKRKVGYRSRKGKGRALTLHRYRQEKLARERSEKNKEALLASECDAESSTRESLPVVTGAAKGNDVGGEKVESKKVAKASEEDEESNPKSEWNDSTAEDVPGDEKKESITSHKKGRPKKLEEVVNMESEPSPSSMQNVKNTAVEDVSSKVVDPVEEDMENEVTETACTEKEAGDQSAKGKADRSKEDDKPLVSVEAETKPMEKKKRDESVHVESSEPKKVAAERKSEDLRTPEKKSDVKVKQGPVDRKVEERKKPKEAKVEKKERKGGEDRRVAEEVVSKEGGSRAGKEEERRSMGKERRVEGKERRGVAEKRVEAGERKVSRDRRLEGEEEVGERASKDEKEPRRGDGEKKIWRERKSEERKVFAEKKEEARKGKAVEEKKTEDLDQSKYLRKESVTPTKKSTPASTPEKSRTPSKSVLITAGVEKLKRRVEAVEEDDSSLDDSLQPPETKMAKLSEEPVVGDIGDNESERRLGEEEASVRRKVDRRKGALNKRVDPDEAIIRSSLAQLEEKSNDGETTPKYGQGRRKAGGSISFSSAPATPMDQIPHSPASSGSISEEERDYRAWKKAILLVWSRLATHKFASIFLRPITNDQAPGYHNVVYRPVDLYTIKKNVENGVIRTTAHFQRDVMLMFLNAIMYNSSDHDVHRMSLQMQQESLQHIQILLEASEAPKILRRETREGNKRSDSSSLVQSASALSQDESSAGAPMSAVGSAPTPAENLQINLSEEEMSECDFPLSYCLSKGTMSGNLPRGITDNESDSDHCRKEDSSDNFRKKYEHKDSSRQGLNMDSMADRQSSAENSNVSDMENDNTEGSVIGRQRDSKKGERKKERKQPQSSPYPDQYPDADLGDEQLSSSQFGDNDMCGSEAEKKQEKSLKRVLNECSMSSDDSSSILDDGGDWFNLMAMKAEKGDDSESVSSVFGKRRRVQRKSTNSDPESLLDAPTFPFSSNFASLEESDYQAWKKVILMVWDKLADHEFATIFMTPVRTDEAPRYYNVVFRPMDLGTIRKNVEKGVVRTISHFQRDVMLMLTNAIMYNPSHHDVHQKTAQMQNKCLQHLQMLVNESSDDPEVFRHEIREVNNKVCSTGIEELAASFRSESPSIEDQLTNIPATGNWLSSSPVHSSLNGSSCAPNDQVDRNLLGKNSSTSERTVRVFSKKRRISAFESV